MKKKLGKGWQPNKTESEFNPVNNNKIRFISENLGKRMNEIMNKVIIPSI